MEVARYFTQTKKVSFWKAFGIFLRTGRWSRWETQYIEVSPEDQRFTVAPYAINVVMHDNVMETTITHVG